MVGIFFFLSWDSHGKVIKKKNTVHFKHKFKVLCSYEIEWLFVESSVVFIGYIKIYSMWLVSVIEIAILSLKITPAVFLVVVFIKRTKSRLTSAMLILAISSVCTAALIYQVVSQYAKKWLATTENWQKDEVLEGDKFQNILKQINCI